MKKFLPVIVVLSLSSPAFSQEKEILAVLEMEVNKQVFAVLVLLPSNWLRNSPFSQTL